MSLMVEEGTVPKGILDHMAATLNRELLQHIKYYTVYDKPLSEINNDRAYIAIDDVKIPNQMYAVGTYGLDTVVTAGRYLIKEFILENLDKSISLRQGIVIDEEIPPGELESKLKRFTISLRAASVPTNSIDPESLI